MTAPAPLDIGAAAKRYRLRLDGPLTGYPGARASVLPGPGTSFAGHRDYQPGDDVRLIDWNVFARHRRPSIKVFRRDHASQFLFIVDASASMQRPDPGKWTCAVEAVALLSALAAINGDRVGCLVAAGTPTLLSPLRMGGRQAAAIAESLERFGRSVRVQASSTWPADGPCQGDGRPRRSQAKADAAGMPLSLTRAALMLPRPGAVVIASDCLDSQLRRPAWIVRLAALRRHRVTLLVVRSPLELELPAVGLVRFADAETGATRWVDTHAGAVRQAYARQAAVRRRELFHEARRAGAMVVELRCDRATIPQLAPVIEKRGMG